jgi:hypothetical protein
MSSCQPITRTRTREQAKNTTKLTKVKSRSKTTSVKKPITESQSWSKPNSPKLTTAHHSPPQPQRERNHPKLTTVHHSREGKAIITAYDVIIIIRTAT